MDLSETPINLHDRVRIHNTPLTHKKKLAGLVGVVHGITMPSRLEARGEKIEIIGHLTEDIAYAVQFENFQETIWFASYLVDFVDYNAGTEISIGSINAVRLDTGEWQEQSGQKRKFKNDVELFFAETLQNQTVSTSTTGKKGFWNWLKKSFFSK
ncbi:MAG: hypothetical protein K2W94_03590 [Alphaproteobacteria bacterium]|nr:hypothetical protein [Alphaproteobacteria bacterium]